jgi:hypothetical protein
LFSPSLYLSVCLCVCLSVFRTLSQSKAPKPRPSPRSANKSTSTDPEKSVFALRSSSSSFFRYWLSSSFPSLYHPCHLLTHSLSCGFFPISSRSLFFSDDSEDSEKVWRGVRRRRRRIRPGGRGGQTARRGEEEAGRGRR